MCVCVSVSLCVWVGGSVGEVRCSGVRCNTTYSCTFLDALMMGLASRAANSDIARDALSLLYEQGHPVESAVSLPLWLADTAAGSRVPEWASQKSS